MPGRPCIQRVGPLLPAAPCMNLREVIEKATGKRSTDTG
jgi:hypothetical protein